MNILEESKLMDKVSNVLRDINKSEKNIEKSYFSMSLFEIKNRNKTNEISEKKDDSTLTVTEKVRYGKIGDNFIKGASEEYIKIIEKIKKEARKKFKEKEKEIQRLQSQESEGAKKEIKKSKKLSKSKLLLIGGAIGVTAFLLKKSYDFLIEYDSKFNFSKVLFDYLPRKISFVKSSINEIDESASTFVLETTGGEKVNLTEESYSKNPIEEAASSFDDILKTYVFEKGINYLINNAKDEESVIGFLLFRPAGIIINKLMRFSEEALTTNRYFYGMGADLFHSIQLMLSPFLSVNEILGKNYMGRYNSLMIISSDAYTNAIARLDKLMRDATPSGGKINLGTFFNRSDIALFVSGLSDFGKKIAQVSVGNPEEFLELFKRVKDFKGLKMGKTETEAYSTSAFVKFGTDTLHEIGFHVDTTKGSSTMITGRKWFPWQKDASEVYMEALSENKDIYRYQKLVEKNISSLPELMLEIRAWHGYNEKLLKPREKMLELMNKDVETYNSSTIESYTDYMIYFQRDLTIHDKFYWIANQYFNVKDKNKNFLLNHLENMKTRAEWAKLKSLSIINHFGSTINPLFYLEEPENSPIREFFNGSKVKIISEHNDQYGNIGSNESLMMYKLKNFSNKKHDLKHLSYTILTRIGNLLMVAYKKYVNYYKSTWNTSQITKIETQYITPSDNSDISIKHTATLGARLEIKENPFK